MLAESSRSEIAGSLQQAGYQLLSLRTTPLPKAGEQRLEDSAAAAKSQQLPDMSAFSSNRYKGVDYRDMSSDQENNPAAIENQKSSCAKVRAW